MSRQSYINGFCKQAAENGIDPRALAKLAMESTPFTEYFAAMPAHSLLYSDERTRPIAEAAGDIGYLAGLMSNEDEANRNDISAMSFMPGAYEYNRGRRIKSQVLREMRDVEKDERNKGARPMAHAIAEHFGPATSTLSSLGIGALIGALANKKDRGLGAILGVAGGGAVSLAATLAASIAAAIRRRRTKQEQIDSDKGSVLAKYLVPGLAVYDDYKRVGRSQGDREESSNNKEDKQ